MLLERKNPTEFFLNVGKKVCKSRWIKRCEFKFMKYEFWLGSLADLNALIKFSGAGVSEEEQTVSIWEVPQTPIQERGWYCN